MTTETLNPNDSAIFTGRVGADAAPSPCNPENVQALFDAVKEELLKPIEQIDATPLVEFLVFHRSKIKPSLINHILTILGHAYKAADEIAESREALLHAGDSGFKSMSAITMSSIHSIVAIQPALGEDLLNSMPTLESRAETHVAIGDYHLVHLQDLDKAYGMYRDALKENPDFAPAYQRILAIDEYRGDWNGALADLTWMHTHGGSNEMAVLRKAAWILTAKLHRPHDAVAVYREMVSKNPEDLGAFRSLCDILLGQGDLDGVRAAYAQSIAALQKLPTPPVATIAEVCREYGDFLRKRCVDLSGAIDAYRTATKLNPDDVDLALLFAKHCAQNEATIAEAIDEYHRILAKTLHRTALTALAMCYRKKKQFDESLCVYRVLHALYPDDRDAAEIVGSFAENDPPRIDTKMPDEVWRHIIPRTIDSSLHTLIKMGTKVVADMFSRDPEDVGVDERRDRIDLSENTTFNNAIRNETEALGFAEVPHLYRCDRYSGVTNAYFSDRSFLIHPNCLKGRSPRELAFMTAKALLLMRPGYYLLEQGAASAELIFRAMLQAVRPKYGFDLDRNQQRVADTLIQGVTEDQAHKLAQAASDLFHRNAVNFARYMETVEDFANRVGLVFCDDPGVVEKLLDEESCAISARPARARVESLMRWGVSRDYFAVRRLLGIKIRR